ncbi:MAG: TonB-dependent receptor domain-containing protein [Erythrobacter sp.]
MSSAAALAIASSPADAQTPPAAGQIDLAPATLPAAIAELSREAGVSIGTEGSLPALRTPRVKGRMSVDIALARLLAGSGYTARRVGPCAWRIERARPVPPPARSAPVSPTPSALSAETVGDPIIVTGSKLARGLASLPMAASVVRFAPDHIASTADGSADIAAGIEGMALSGQGPGRNRMFLRGIADSPFNGETQSTVAVVLDESRLTYSAPDPDLRLVDVEQVEVLKGPQGSLYGSGALGGIYRIATRKPEPGEASLTVSSGGQVMAAGSTGYSLAAVANLPVGDSAAVRLVGYSGYDAGWIDSGPRDDGNATRILGGRGAVRLLFGAGWEAEVGGAIQLLDSQDTQYVYAPERRSRPAQLQEPHDNDLTHGALRIIGRIGAAKLAVSTGYTTHEITEAFDATQGADQFGLADPRSLANDRQFRVWDSELRLSGSWRGAEWLIGASHIEARQTLRTRLDSFSLPGVLVLDDDRRTNADTALFGDVSFPLGASLRLDAGGRLFTSTSLESRDTAIGRIARRQTKQGFTPTIALAWTPRADRLIYLRYGSAFRPGGADIAADGTLEPLEADELQTIEAGWRETLADGGMLEVGSYFSRWENIQSDMLRPDGLLESANVGNALIIGAEASAALPLVAGWSLDAGVSVTHATLTSLTVPLGLDDLHLPVVPDFTLRGGIDHSFTLGDAPARIGMQLRYLGPSRLSFDPAIDQPMGKVLESSLFAQTQLAGFDVRMEIENLLDRRDNLFAYGNPLRFALARQYTPQTPFSARVTVQRSF